MWMVINYFFRTISPADITRYILTLFLIYLVSLEGFYTSIAIAIIFVRYEVTVGIERVKRDVIENPKKVVDTIILDEIIKNNK